MSNTETFGRAMVIFREDGGIGSAIYIKRTLAASFDTVPRPVRHVGSKQYIQTLWNKIKKDKKYLEDVKSFEDYLLKDKQYIGL